MKTIFSAITVLSMLISGYGQRYFTKNAIISFYSDTPFEKIEAFNKSSNIVIDFSTGRVEMATLIKGFQFDKALMQEHFNENYLESNKYPKANFKGQILNHTKIDWKKDGKMKVTVTGDLTIKDITKKINTTSILEIKGDQIMASTDFLIHPTDYNVAIPNIVKDKIAKELKISVTADMKHLGK